jgi:chaperonin GroEL
MLCDNIIEIVKEKENPMNGYDIVSGKFFENMIHEGIVDSFNTIKTSIDDSVSVASLLITTECIVIKEVDYDRKLYELLFLRSSEIIFMFLYFILMYT